MPDYFKAIDILRGEGEAMLRRFVRSHRGTVYADLRFEVVFSRWAMAENGEPRTASEHTTTAYGVSVHCGETGGVIGHGYAGAEIGNAATSRTRLMRELASALECGWDRARASARAKLEVQRDLTGLGALFAGPLPPLKQPARADEQAVFGRDPRSIDRGEITNLCVEGSRAASGVSKEVAFNTVAALAELRHEVFISSEGALISQGFAFSQGDCYVVAQAGEGYQENYDTIGQQRGFEVLLDGCASNELMPNTDIVTFATTMARETHEEAAAPALRAPEGEVTIVTDPHFNALLAHEIVGHPSEADRALKSEAAYAGRSWFLRSLGDNEIGRPVGSPLFSACSDPTLDGYGRYLYDHEGMPGRRVVHIEDGVFRGFLNSRATAAALGVEPNGAARAAEARYVPLIRMNNTFIMPGTTPPETIIADVEHGYYVVGHRIPSIAESRENFRISARRVYEIENGRLGRMYRCGSVMSDSKRFFTNVDAVGNDLRLIAIPNCGKGQPMQVKRMSNGGPTLRSRGWLRGA